MCPMTSQLRVSIEKNCEHSKNAEESSNNRINEVENDIKQSIAESKNLFGDDSSETESESVDSYNESDNKVITMRPKRAAASMGVDRMEMTSGGKSYSSKRSNFFYESSEGISG